MKDGEALGGREGERWRMEERSWEESPRECIEG